MNRSTSRSVDAAEGQKADPQHVDRHLDTQQEQVTLSMDGRDVQGVLHRLKEASAAPRPAVAIVQGVAGSSSEYAQQVLTSLAEAIARVDMVALRLHLPGQDGLGYEAQLRQAQLALDLLAQQQDIDVDHLAIVGPGWSVAAAACLSRFDARVAGIVMWGPAWGSAAGETGEQEIGASDCAGFYQGQPTKALPAKVLIIHGTSGKALSQQQAQQLEQSFGQVGITAEMTVIGDMNTDAGDPHWFEVATEQTVEWLQGALSQGE